MAEFKSMTGSQPNESHPIRQEAYFTCSLTAVWGENLEEGFLCFSRLTDCAASRFNLALCFVMAGLHEKALEALEQAEKLISPIHAELGQTAVPQELLLRDEQSESYRAPMARQTPAFFPAQAKLRILRLNQKNMRHGMPA